MSNYSKPDHWSLKAQKEGYPARSVYKLKEMDEKFGLLRGGPSPFKVLDLGAAPGSWSLYILRKLSSRKADPKGGGPLLVSPLLVSIDLSALSRACDQGLFDRPDFVFIQGDFYQDEVRKAILSHGPYDLILSDAAPATSGNRSVDSLRSLELAEGVLDYAADSLRIGGNLALKIFQGGDSGDLLKKMGGLFEKAKSFKPRSCRPGSFECYYLGLEKK
ncbi:MAG: RlmE family RNA methyltransferase [Treponema sp.]|nr:RlmE family RNA methyltransferase [Treponema sp.]